MDGVKEPSDIRYHNTYLNYLTSAINAGKNQSRVDDTIEPLTEYEKSVFVSILSDMVHQLGILNGGKLSAEPKTIPKKSMKARFNRPILADLYDERTLRPFGEALQAICEIKVENDLAMMRELLDKCRKELKLTGTFEILSDFVASKQREACDEYELIRIYMKNSTIANELYEKWRSIENSGRDHSAELEYRFDSEAERTELKRMHSMEQNMVKKWEDSRLEQVTDVFDKEIKRLENENSTLCRKTMDDSMTMERLKVFNDCKYNKIEALIVYWTERCAVEKNVLGEEIKRTKSQIKTVWTKYETLRDSYREREAFIENYRSEQKMLEKQRQQESKKRNAALYIQAWWRGIMVRKQLGPYRPKKKKAKKGGKN